MKNNNENTEELIINKLLQLLSKDVLKYIPSKILPAIISVISIPVFTNLFPPSEYGIYSLAMSTVNLISTITFGWIYDSIIRYYDEYTNEKESKNFFSNISILTIIIFSIVFLISLVITIFFLDQIKPYKYIIAFSILMFYSLTLMSISKRILRASRKSGVYSFMTVLLSLGKLLFVILFYEKLSFLGVSIIILGTLLMEILIVLISFYIIKPKININYFNKKFIKEIARYGFPLMAASACYWFLSVSDRYIIGIFRSTEEVGLYSISYNISSKSLTLVFSIISLAAFPLIVKAWNNHKKEYVEDLLSKIVKYYYILTVPIVSAIFIISPLLLEILASEKYLSGYIVMPWISLSILLRGVTTYLHYAWQLNKNTMSIFYLNLISAIVNIVINLIFVPKYGFIAAGISTFIAYLTYLVLAYRWSRDILKIDLITKELVKIIYASVFMLVPVSLLLINLESGILTFIYIVLVGSSFYFLILYFNGVLKSEIDLIFNKIMRRF